MMQENNRLLGEVSGLQKLCALHKQEAKASAEGKTIFLCTMSFEHGDFAIFQIAHS